MKANLMVLTVVLFTTACAWCAEDKGATATNVKRVGVDEYDKLRANTNFVILDVRSAAEFEKGRIPGAINIDINSLNFSNQVSALDKNKTYLVNCAVGMRSARACKKMESMGFTNLFDLAPGFDGWKKAGKPTTK
jgi:rhodanese-related sulfurtransferase